MVKLEECGFLDKFSGNHANICASYVVFVINRVLMRLFRCEIVSTRKRMCLIKLSGVINFPWKRD